MHRRRMIGLTLRFALITSAIAMIWKGCLLLTNCTHPLLIVESATEPGRWYSHGDLLIITNYQSDSIRAGDNVVFKIEGRDIPIIHRVIQLHERNDGKIYLLTKGDGSYVDDRALYSMGQLWLEKKDIIGKVKGYIPYLGIGLILMKNLFQLNFFISSVMIVFVLTYDRWKIF